MGSARFLPLQVAAVCYRKCGASFEFLLVNTTSGDRWIFPKGAAARRLSHSQAAEREAFITNSLASTASTLALQSLLQSSATCKESGKPVHVATENTDLTAELKRGLSFVRREKEPSASKELAGKSKKAKRK